MGLCRYEKYCVESGGIWCDLERETPEGEIIPNPICAEVCPVCGPQVKKGIDLSNLEDLDPLNYQLPQNCWTSDSCENQDFNWCKLEVPSFLNPMETSFSVFCSDETCPRCSLEFPQVCFREDDCINGGAQWCDFLGTDGEGNEIPFKYCDTSCPECNIESPWDCRAESDCNRVGATWCEEERKTFDGYEYTNRYCSDGCPYCSFETPWNCFNEGDCISSNLNWCEYKVATSNPFTGEIGEQTQFNCDKQCPQCDVETPWDCWTESSCESAGAEWCIREGELLGHCYDVCPVCASESLNYCEYKLPCELAGGEWCIKEFEDGSSFQYCDDSCTN